MFVASMFAISNVQQAAAQGNQTSAGGGNKTGGGNQTSAGGGAAAGGGNMTGGNMTGAGPVTGGTTTGLHNYILCLDEILFTPNDNHSCCGCLALRRQYGITTAPYHIRGILRSFHDKGK